MITPQLKAIEVKRRGERAGGGGGGLREGKNRDRKRERVRNKGTMGEAGGMVKQENGRIRESCSLNCSSWFGTWRAEEWHYGARPLPKMLQTVSFYQFTPYLPAKKVTTTTNNSY